MDVETSPVKVEKKGRLRLSDLPPYQDPDYPKLALMPGSFYPLPKPFHRGRGLGILPLPDAYLRRLTQYLLSQTPEAAVEIQAREAEIQLPEVLDWRDRTQVIPTSVHELYAIRRSLAMLRCGWERPVGQTQDTLTLQHVFRALRLPQCVAAGPRPTRKGLRDCATWFRSPLPGSTADALLGIGKHYLYQRRRAGLSTLPLTHAVRICVQMTPAERAALQADYEAECVLCALGQP